MKIQAYRKGIDFIAKLVACHVPIQTKRTLCAIHSAIASCEVPQSQLGRFRTHDVRLQDVQYTPPHYKNLDDLWDVFSSVTFADPCVCACISFLQIARTQFFYDCNKRTAFLYAKAILLENNIIPFSFPTRAEFTDILKRFYENGNADEILTYLLR